MSTKTASPRLSSKYQIVIPTEVRKRMGLLEGMRIWIQPMDESHALLTKEPADHVESMSGLGADLWKKLGGGATYLKKERAVWKQR